MKVPIYQVDAFSDKVFSGNPAAICPLENWMNDNPHGWKYWKQIWEILYLHFPGVLVHNTGDSPPWSTRLQTL